MSIRPAPEHLLCQTYHIFARVWEGTLDARGGSERLDCGD